MTDWTYGDAGDEYPTENGDLWIVAGHALLCADLYARPVPTLIERVRPVSPVAAYVDPPWGAALEAGFRTKAGLDTPDLPPPERWREFCIALVTALIDGAPYGPWFIEGSAHDSSLDVIEDVARERAHVRRGGEWYGTYYGDKEMRYLLLLPPGAPDPPDDLDLTGVDDEDSPGRAMLAYPSFPTWFDPCLGRGLTLRHAIDHGRDCLGVELHPRRLAVAVRHASENRESFRTPLRPISRR